MAFIGLNSVQVSEMNSLGAFNHSQAGRFSQVPVSHSRYHATPSNNYHLTKCELPSFLWPGTKLALHI